ncbi:MAG: hypothetical protein JWR21_2840 [Herminiimonas sp.]|nr:hypothetical protein [Herminiimonas sp.]MDB5856248.1 hypothetical protein [Herminiimonas sp.]
MGISLSWVAVEGLLREDIFSRLELEHTGKDYTYPFDGIAGHPLPNGWFLVAASRCDHRVISAESMARLSLGCKVVSCAIEEHVDFASTEFWQDSKQIWSVQHQGDESPDDISFEGDLPEHFHILLSSVESEYSESLDGHFHVDIPLILAQELAGYRHDEADPQFDDIPFEELKDLRIHNPRWKLWR